MYRKHLVAASTLAVVALLAAACTLPAPAERNWKVSPTSVKVIDQEDFDPGDEPYVIQLGFRSKLGVENSSSAFVVSQCRSRALPANDSGTPGTTLTIPAGSADVSFPATQSLDLGDVLIGTALLEIFGTLSFVMERDGVFVDSCAITDLLDNALTGVLADALDVLIAGSDVPPTQDELIDLIVSNLGDLLSAIPGLIAAVLEGLGNPDDILGIAAQIHLPTQGAFADLLNFGLAIAGFDQGVIEIDDLPPTLRFRVGNLLPSQATFSFAGPGYEYEYTSSVIAG